MTFEFLQGEITGLHTAGKLTVFIIGTREVRLAECSVASRLQEGGFVRVLARHADHGGRTEVLAVQCDADGHIEYCGPHLRVPTIAATAAMFALGLCWGVPWVQALSLGVFAVLAQHGEGERRRVLHAFQSYLAQPVASTPEVAPSSTGTRRESE
jgi:hypothetical protein